MSKPYIPTSPHPIPNEEAFSDIYNLPLLSFDGKSSSFGELVTARDGVLNVVVIFIRHFFCSCDQDYVRSIALYFTPTVLSTLPIGASRLIIVGCGDPSRILPFVAETSCKLKAPDEKVLGYLQKTAICKTVLIQSYHKKHETNGY